MSVQNFSVMAEDRIVKFCARLAREVLVVWWQSVPQAGVVKVTWRLIVKPRMLMNEHNEIVDIFVLIDL